MMYRIISKENCSYCVRAKELLERHGLSYSEENLTSKFGEDKRAMKEYLKTLDTGITTVPQIWKEEQFVGGFTNLETTLMSEITFDESF